ncbi:MAG: hypothetical protein Q7T53_03205 [Deltaproteobacteria bacterium]|nr:hypothetical protein [Deltaproteobacteria bacterium]
MRALSFAHAAIFTAIAVNNQVLAAEYRMALPDEKTLAAEVERTRRMLEKRAALKSVRRK